MNQFTKDHLIKILSDALNVCKNVEYGDDADANKSSYYAVGYSRTVIQGALDIITNDYDVSSYTHQEC